jgi:hyaluronoglucosaminidase
MNKIGIVEGFFGPAWSQEARLSFAPFLQQYGGSFYIYAPKRDPYLRKEWRAEWSEKYLTELGQLISHFHKYQLQFGVGLSPFGLGDEISEADKILLHQKFQLLAGLKIDMLGLFFDDMPVTHNLLSNQLEVVQIAQKYFSRGLIFCPSFYSFDPILDKVFGKRPDGYVENLKDKIAQAIEICWTGPKVISDEITTSHLLEVKELLGRKPFIWENIFANDGPRNCKFLKLKYFSGRDKDFVEHISGLALNLMNQPHLSKILFLSALKVLRENLSPEKAFSSSCHELCTEELAAYIEEHRELFLSSGLDQISEEKRRELKKELPKGQEAAEEINDWLDGKYLVGPECLTD